MTFIKRDPAETVRSPRIFYKHILEFLPEAHTRVGSIRVLQPLARNTVLAAFKIAGGNREGKQEVAKDTARWYEFSVPDEAAMVFDGLVRLRKLAIDKLAPTVVIDSLDCNLRELTNAVRAARDDVPSMPQLGDLAHRMAVTLIEFGSNEDPDVPASSE